MTPHQQSTIYLKNKQLEELEKIDNKLITLRKELTSLNNQSIILRGLFKNE